MNTTTARTQLSPSSSSPPPQSPLTEKILSLPTFLAFSSAEESFCYISYFGIRSMRMRYHNITIITTAYARDMACSYRIVNSEDSQDVIHCTRSRLSSEWKKYFGVIVTTRFFFLTVFVFIHHYLPEWEKELGFEWNGSGMELCLSASLYR